jgi:hypothetical protein
VTHANDETEFLARQLLDSVHAAAAGRLMEMLGLGADDLAELCKRIEAGRIDGRMWPVASSASICLRSRAAPDASRPAIAPSPTRAALPRVLRSCERARLFARGERRRREGCHSRSHRRRGAVRRGRTDRRNRASADDSAARRRRARPLPMSAKAAFGGGKATFSQGLLVNRLIEYLSTRHSSLAAEPDESVIPPPPGGGGRSITIAPLEARGEVG